MAKKPSSRTYHYYMEIRSTHTVIAPYYLGWRTKPYNIGLEFSVPAAPNAYAIKVFHTRLTDFLNKTTGNATELTIKPWDADGRRMPSDLIDKVLDALDKNKYVTEVDQKDNMVGNDEQQQKLKNILERNRRGFAATQRQNHWFWIGTAVTLTIQFVLPFMSLGTTAAKLLTNEIGKSVVGVLSLIGIGCAKLRQYYLNYCASYYKTPRQINTINNKAEITAVLAGVEATTWRTFISSSIGRGTWNNTRHCQAFAAGEQLAAEGDFEAIEALRTRSRTLR